MFDMYFPVVIGWRRRVGVSDKGTTSYAPPRSEPPLPVSAQVNMSRRLIRTAKGEEIVSEGYIMTAAAVIEGDLLVIYGREWPVIAAHTQNGLMGGEIYREARF